MAKKTPLKCVRGTKRFTVVRVNGSSSDTHAGRSYQEARALAMPDRGSKLDVFVVCATDGSAARLNYKQGKLVKSTRVKR